MNETIVEFIRLGKQKVIWIHTKYTPQSRGENSTGYNRLITSNWIPTGKLIWYSIINNR
jgi:hypothetical protein